MTRRLREIPLLTAVAIVSAVLIVIVHEIGHTIAARLLGDSAATFTLFERTATSTCIGCNEFDPQALSALGRLLVSIAGVAATLICAIVLLGVLRQVAGHTWLRNALRVALALFVADLPFQWVQAWWRWEPGRRYPTNVDFEDTVLLAQQNWNIAPSVLALGAGVAICLVIVGFARAALATGRNKPAIAA